MKDLSSRYVEGIVKEAIVAFCSGKYRGFNFGLFLGKLTEEMGAKLPLERGLFACRIER